ncbi:hypothetical protein DICVIV_12093 [Dictyocaulus viviparus]|uniref:Uncharacterized protein n=1 Tax=Dictyocaulus viviparus TaxID=29172 RepID=A0A0D8XBD9_DICVI|nr:hypothetical protein DICVIV_12093 [Dictyocaulus viviparus]
MDSHEDGGNTPFIDVALTLRSCGCGYLIVLTIYLNTLLMIVLSDKQTSADQRQRPQIQSATMVTQRTQEKPVEKKEKSILSIFSQFKEQATQEMKDELSTAASRSKKQPGSKEGKMKVCEPDRTLKSARMSIRLPRAPKGHHIEELDQMEKFLAEDDASVLDK